MTAPALSAAVVELRTARRARPAAPAPAEAPADTATCALPDPARHAFADLAVEASRLQATFAASFTTVRMRRQAIDRLAAIEAHARVARAALKRADRARP